MSYPLPPDENNPDKRYGIVVRKSPANKIIVRVHANLSREEASILRERANASGNSGEPYHMDHAVCNPSEIGETKYRGFAGSSESYKIGDCPWQTEALAAKLREETA